MIPSAEDSVKMCKPSSLWNYELLMSVAIDTEFVVFVTQLYKTNTKFVNSKHLKGTVEYLFIVLSVLCYNRLFAYHK